MDFSSFFLGVSQYGFCRPLFCFRLASVDYKAFFAENTKPIFLLRSKSPIITFAHQLFYLPTTLVFTAWKHNNISPTEFVAKPKLLPSISRPLPKFFSRRGQGRQILEEP
nr:hypothetical protein Itr_chr09CG10510 [Ipomoea trifida]